MKLNLQDKILAMSKFFMYMAWIQALFATVAFAHGGHAQQLEKVQIVNVWQNIPLKDAFRDIQNQTDFFFTYDSRQIKEVKISSVEEKLPLLEVLKYISSQTGLSFSIKDQLILVDYDKKLFGGKELAVSEIILPTLGKLQEVNSEVIYMVSFEDQNFDENIKGQVNDKYGNPLVGATVVVKETGQGTVTDVDGTFSVAVPNAGRVTLVVSYVGFTTKEVSVSRTANINITLDQNVSELEEIVVTALGVSKEKKALAYSIQGLDNEEFNQSRNGDLISQLSGRVPGLSILQNPSGVASSSRITLRGSSSLSLGSNQPLFVVDGVPISNDINSSEAAPSRAQLQSIDFGNSILDLNPDDIASINVLKGPNAAALYGSRAANGAIIITTRSAENGKGAVVEVNTGITFEEVVRDWDFQNQFSAGSDDVYRANWGWNWGVPLDGTFRAVQPESPLFPEEDVLLPRWNSNDFWETGVAYNNNISVALGGEKNSVRFSVTNLQKTGIIPNNDYSKTNFSINTRSQLSDQWSLDIVGNYVKTGSDNISSTRYSSSGIMYSFVFAHANADLGLFKEYWAEGQEGVQQRYYQTWADNPFFIANEHINSFEKDRFFGNAKLNFELNENFKFHTRIGTDVFTDNQFSRRPYSSQWFPQGMYQENSFTFQETNIDFLATYNKSFENNIGLNISVGANSFQQDRNRSGLFGNSLAVPNLYNPGNIAGTPIVSRTNSRKRINSVYGNLELSFSNAIYLTATGRNDWSSTLPVQNNSYFYPSVGASIVLSELIELPSIFSYAKLRSSWAQVGSDTDPFLINRSYDFGRLPSSVQNQDLLPNSDLKPEETNSFEIGAEMSFLSNLLSLNFNYYKVNTKNQIFQAPISEASGFNAELINAGEIENEGVEGLVTVNPLQGEFNWTMTLNYSRNRNRVVSLAEGVESLVLFEDERRTIEARPGDNLFVLYGLGLQRTENGSVIYQDGLPLLSSSAQRIGRVTPNWTSGISNQFSYKQFSLGVLIDYRNGGIVSSLTNALLYRAGNNTESLVGRDVGITGEGVVVGSDGSTSPNEENVSARAFYQSFYNRSNIETNAFDATYLKIREISLSVNMTEWIENKWIDNMRLTLFARNILAWTKSENLRHFDPEISLIDASNGRIIPGLESAQLPGTATFGFNLNIRIK